ncbi:deoxycytidyl transferase, partial [Desmophyllum pertusum]
WLYASKGAETRGEYKVIKEDIPKGPQDVNASQIFEKVVIHINGYTVPPADELRRLVYLHGGVINRTNLLYIHHGFWTAIKAARLLPVDEYLLYQGRKASQKVLNFTSKLSSTCTTTKPPPGGVPSAETSTLQSPCGGPTEDMSSTSIPSPTGASSVSGLSALLTTTVQDQISDVHDSNDKISINTAEKDLVSRGKMKEMLTENPQKVVKLKILAIMKKMKSCVV